MFRKIICACCSIIVVSYSMSMEHSKEVFCPSVLNSVEDARMLVKYQKQNGLEDKKLETIMNETKKTWTDKIYDFFNILWNVFKLSEKNPDLTFNVLKIARETLNTVEEDQEENFNFRLSKVLWKSQTEGSEGKKLKKDFDLYIVESSLNYLLACLPSDKMINLFESVQDVIENDEKASKYLIFSETITKLEEMIKVPFDDVDLLKDLLYIASRVKSFETNIGKYNKGDTTKGNHIQYELDFLYRSDYKDQNLLNFLIDSAGELKPVLEKIRLKYTKK